MYDILNQNIDIQMGHLTWNKLYAFTQEDWVQIYKYLSLSQNSSQC